MRIGIIGTGVMGEYHTRIYSEMENNNSDIHIVGIADINKNRLEEISKKYKISTSKHQGYIETYTDYNLLLNEKLDAVSICVPTSMHYEVAVAAIQKGVRYLLIEKPITDNLNTANDIVKFATDKGVTILVGHVERFNPSVQEMKKIIEHGRLGDVVSISAKRVSRPNYPRHVDTGVIIDLAVHDFDVICYLYGMFPTDVYSIAGIGEKSNNREDRAIISLKFNDHCAGIIETNWLTPKTIRTLDIVGTEAVAHLDYIDQKIVISENEKNEEIKFTKQEPLMKEIEHFINVATGKELPLVTGYDGINALNIATAAIKSYKTGNVINMCNMK